MRSDGHQAESGLPIVVPVLVANAGVFIWYRRTAFKSGNSSRRIRHSCSGADGHRTGAASPSPRPNAMGKITTSYRGVRHPMYSALALYSVGQALVIPNWVAGPSNLVAFTVLFALRIGAEERMMAQQFGIEYAAYTAR